MEVINNLIFFGSSITFDLSVVESMGNRSDRVSQPTLAAICEMCVRDHKNGIFFMEKIFSIVLLPQFFLQKHFSREKMILEKCFSKK